MEILGKVTALSAWRACAESVRALDRSDSRAIRHQRQCGDRVDRVDRSHYLHW